MSVTSTPTRVLRQFLQEAEAERITLHGTPAAWGISTTRCVVRPALPSKIAAGNPDDITFMQKRLSVRGNQ